MNRDAPRYKGPMNGILGGFGVSGGRASFRGEGGEFWKGLLKMVVRSDKVRSAHVRRRGSARGMTR